MEKLKLFRIIRDYGESRILDICWAIDKEDVYRIMNWTKEDKPVPQIIELPTEEARCILSVHLWVKTL